jgi:hypothetical protein
VASRKVKKKGPAAERVKIKGAWEEAVKKALSKPRPDNGWPMENTETKRPKTIR